VAAAGAARGRLTVICGCVYTWMRSAWQACRDGRSDLCAGGLRGRRGTGPATRPRRRGP